MIATRTEKFREAVADAAAKLVRVDFRDNSAFIDTPLLYPSGGTVVVRVDREEDDFFVTDMGLGFEEADLGGAGATYSRYAKVVADSAGVGFDQHAFFVVRANRDQIAGAVATIANCSMEAAAIAALKHADKRSVERVQQFYDRLVRIFHEPNVERRGKIIGASDIEYEMDAVVKGKRRPVVFEVVSNQHTSVYVANSKFHDLKELELPPVNVAVVHRKKDMGTYIGLLSQAAHVIEDDVRDASIEELALAA